MGCWAIGGPLWYRKDPVGWGAVALAWIWARSPATIPIPGCRTVAQLAENAAALARGPLTRAQLDEIGAILG